MKRTLLLQAVIAGVISGVALQAEAKKSNAPLGAEGKEIECHGANACKGKGDCGGPQWSCAGNNTCRGKGFVVVRSQKECDRLLAKMRAKKPAKAK